MLASDVRVQSTVRSLDQGRLGAFVKAAMFAALIAGPSSHLGWSETFRFLKILLGWLLNAAFFNASPEEYFLRDSKVDLENSGTTLQGKARAHVVQQMQMIFGYLGMNAAAASFFLVLFHPFRNGRAQAFQWCLLLMWVFAVFGMALYHPTGVVSQNQFHVLFVPLFVGYGMAFLFVLWNRLDSGGQFLRNLFVSALLFVCAIPMLLSLLAGQKNRINWPPYVPAYIGIMRDWFKEDEIICSDMAVAWYAQRISLLLPDSVRTFNRMHDYGETLLTPLTGDQPLFSGIYKGPYRDWAALITRPPQVLGFALPEFRCPLTANALSFPTVHAGTKPGPHNNERKKS